MSQEVTTTLVPNQLSKVWGTFFSPVVTFRELVKKPGWITPLLILTVLSLAYTIEMDHHIGWAKLIQFRIAHSLYASLPAGEQESFIQQQLPLTMFMGYFYASFGTVVELLAVAGVLYVLFANGRLTFKQAFSIVSYAFLPSGLAALLGIFVISMKNPDDFDPNRVLTIDVGAFFGEGSIPAHLSMLLSSIDLFSLWILLLTASGFWVASGSKSFLVAFGKVLAPWLIWIALRVALS